PDRMRTHTSRLRLLLALANTVVWAIACVHPTSSSWRLANNTLIPPGLSSPTLMRTTVKATATRSRACPPQIRIGRRQVAIKIVRRDLTNREPGWLAEWTSDLEAQGCIAPGEAFRLANAIAQSLPLEMNTAFRLLHPSDPDVVEIDPNVRLQVMTP